MSDTEPKKVDSNDNDIAGRLKLLLQEKATLKELYAANLAYGKSIGMTKEEVNRVNRAYGTQREMINKMSEMAKVGAKLANGETAKLRDVLAIKKLISNIDEGQIDIVRARVQATADLAKQNVMIVTGLKGAYAEQALQLNAAKEMGALTDAQYNKAIKQLQVDQQQVEVITKEKELMEEIAAEQLKLIESSNQYKKKFEGFLATTKAIFSSPAAMAGAATMAAKKMGDAFSETYKELKAQGLSATQATSEAISSFTDSMSTGFLTSGKSIREARKAISDMGGTLQDANAAGTDVANLVSVYGGSEAAAGKMYGTMTKVAGMSKEAALAAVEFGSALSVASGVPADTVTKAVSENAEAAALSGPKFADSFAKAAVNAKKLGIEMSSVSAMQKSVLDFESSINAQMEASVLLGREVNLDKARELALAGDLQGMQAEILKQVGSAAEFDRMNVLQKEALAKSMGVSVSDMSKMVHGQAELTALGKEAAEAKNAEAGFGDRLLNAAKERAGSILGAIPGLVLQTAQLFSQLSMMKSMKMLSGQQTTSGLLGNRGGMLGTLTGGLLGKKMPLPEIPKIPKTDGLLKAGSAMGGGGMMMGFKENMSSLAAGFMAMGLPGVLKGVGNTFLAGPALIGALLAIPFLLFMGLTPLRQLSINFTSLAAGLVAMAPTMMGSLALGAFGIAAIPALISIPFLLFMGLTPLQQLGTNLLSLAGGLMAMIPTMMGSLALGAFAVAGALAIPSLIFLGGIALIGAAGAAGLTALGVGLASLGAVALTGAPFVAIALIGALGLAMIPFGIALGQAAPALKVIGDIIVRVFSAIPPIIGAVADGFVKMFGAVSQDIGSLLLLGPAMIMIGTGLGIMAYTGLAAMPIIGMLIALATVAPALVGLGAALGGMFGGEGGDKKEDKMDTLIAEIRALKAIASGGGVINMDGKKVGEVIRQAIPTLLKM